MNSLTQQAESHGSSPDYTVLAKIYDSAVALPVFPLLCGAFIHTVTRHNITYRSLADLGCGTGNFLRFIARKGAASVGVDHSPAMLDIAKNKNKTLPIQFFQQDLRNLQLPIPVDLISCQFDTLNYFLRTSELNNVLARCSQSLNANGHLLFDFITGSGAVPLNQKKKIRYGPWISYWTIQTCPDKNLSRVRVTVTDAHTTAHRISEVHVQRWYPLKVILRLLQQTGFTLIECFDLEKLKPASHESYWVQILARKNTS